VRIDVQDSVKLWTPRVWPSLETRPWIWGKRRPGTHGMHFFRSL